MDALTAHPASPIPDYPVGRGSRIIVIDDDDCVGQAIQSILARHGHEVLLAPRASAGIQAFESATFDAALIDLFMPGMNGLDTIAHIRRGSSIPIIAMSGFRLRNSLNSTDYFSMAMERGASAVIRKPFSGHELLELIDRSLALATSKKEFVQ